MNAFEEWWSTAIGISDKTRNNIAIKRVAMRAYRAALEHVLEQRLIDFTVAMPKNSPFDMMKFVNIIDPNVVKRELEDLE